MIYQVTSSLNSFKTVRLNPGLNLIVAEKSKGATSRQTRNGSGKSSFVRIIDFLLGAKCDADSIFSSESLVDESFGMTFDLGGQRTTALRSGGESIVIFEEFSKQISDHEGSLVIEPKDNGPEFSINVEGKESKGIRSMQIFCFDMTLAVLWSNRKAGPEFLVHDSHLFDGMDSRQVARAIEIGASQAKQHGFQYIVCINSDQLKAAEFAKGFDPSVYRNPVEITDASEIGGIFGMRIKG